MTAKPGDYVCWQRGSTHAYRIDSDKPARMKYETPQGVRRFLRGQALLEKWPGSRPDR
ncbi:hypothetical protein [Pseudomonas gessardii]|uniref:hypothetical protein n=1 Tax=Pseudomonas gessardii TaxID=78544 RepID=UPI0039B0EBED